MIPYAFWCSKCQVRHAGECPTAVAVPLGNGGVITAHDWKQLPVVDLSFPYRCQKCGSEKSVTIVASLYGDPKNHLPAGPCP